VNDMPHPTTASTDSLPELDVHFVKALAAATELDKLGDICQLGNWLW
jgi:hypothetical protein